MSLAPSLTRSSELLTVLLTQEVSDDHDDCDRDGHDDDDKYIMIQCLFVTFLFIPAPPPAPLPRPELLCLHKT